MWGGKLWKGFNPQPQVDDNDDDDDNKTKSIIEILCRMLKLHDISIPKIILTAFFTVHRPNNT